MSSKIEKIIGDRHINRIVLLLYFSGRRSKTEIYNMISTNPRMPVKLQELVNEGYVRMSTVGPHGRCKHMMELTPLGNELAEGLCDLEVRIGGDVEQVRERYGSVSSRGEIDWSDQS